MPTKYDHAQAQAYRDDPRAIVGRPTKQSPANVIIEGEKSGIGVTEETANILKHYLNTLTAGAQGNAGLLALEQDIVTAEKNQRHKDARKFMKDSEAGPIDFVDIKLGPETVEKLNKELADHKRRLTAVNHAARTLLNDLLASAQSPAAAQRIADDYAALYIEPTAVGDKTYREVEALRIAAATGRPLLFELYKLNIALAAPNPDEIKRLRHKWNAAGPTMPTLAEVRAEIKGEKESSPAALAAKAKAESDKVAAVANAESAAAMAQSRMNRSDATVK